jgi:hypothetical protein
MRSPAIVLWVMPATKALLLAHTLPVFSLEIAFLTIINIKSQLTL